MCDSGVFISDAEEGVQNGLCQQSETEDIPLLPLPPTLQAVLPVPSTSHGNGDTPAHIDVMEAAARTPGTGAADDDLEPTDIRVEALHIAVRTLDVAAVKTLLASGAPITRAVRGTPALHLCMERYNCRLEPDAQAKTMEIIKAMVAAAKELEVLNYRDKDGQTPLCVAIMRCRFGSFGAAKALVNAGVHLYDLNDCKDSALHVAIKTGCYDTMKYFLVNHKIRNSVNNRGEAPIHIAALCGEVKLFEFLIRTFGTDQLCWQTKDQSTVWHYISSYYIAKYLFQDVHFRENLNVVAASGTPLDAVVSRGDMPMAKLLLRNGAKLAVKGDKETAIKEITSHSNTSLKFFEDLFDECINKVSDDIYVDYKMIACRDMSQIKVLEDFMRSGLSKILKHPTIESLIYFKWRCLLPVFYTILVTYVTFLMSLNIFVITTFNTIDTSNVTCGGPEVTFNAAETPLNAAETSCVGSCGWRHWTLVLVIYISTGVLITQEFVWIYLQKLHHFGRPETWLKLGVLVLALTVPVFLDCSPAPDSMTWQRHAACLAVLLAWLQAMLLLSRIPGWGYYVLMLERVAINILKILATTVFLVIGFSTCLMIQYQSKPPFDGPVAAFTKTLVMMASEFDYEDLFGEDHEAELKNTKVVVRCLFVVFVIFIAIVLMNFMIGVAVSDVNELNDIGNIRRLEMQVQLLSTLEGLGETVLSEWWPRLRFIRFHEKIGCWLTEPGRSWKVNTQDERYRIAETVLFTVTFSSELHNAINYIAQKKEQNVNKPETLAKRSQPNDNVSIESTSPVATLDERMKSIEDANRELKESMDKVLEMSASSRSPALGSKISSSRMISIADTNSEMKQSIDSLREDVNKILAFVAGTAQTKQEEGALFQSSVSETKGT